MLGFEDEYNDEYPENRYKQNKVSEPVHVRADPDKEADLITTWDLYLCNNLIKSKNELVELPPNAPEKRKKELSDALELSV